MNEHLNKNFENQPQQDLSSEIHDGVYSALHNGVSVVRPENTSLNNEQVALDSINAYTNLSYEADSRDVTIDLSESFFGPTTYAGEHGVAAFIVNAGEAALQVLHGKKASEIPLQPGDIVILDASGENDKTWFGLVGEGSLNITSLRSETERYMQQERSSDLGAIGAKGRRSRHEAKQNTSLNKARKFGRAINKVR